MTQKLLRLDASSRTDGSVSRALADQVVEKLEFTEVVHRDLAADIPQLNAEWLNANGTPEQDRGMDEKAALALSDTLIAEVKSADTVLISTPIYNFGVPSSLKAWFDQIARAGITFEYTADGPRGLLKGKRAILVVASGGTEVDSPIDFATPWLRHVMNFIGIEDVQVVRSDKLMVDADASMQRAVNDIAALAA
ncbi:FMN-dependent NADH-azoreductase [Thalassococcus lentus]|uniref:FMN dependent NADH:quinone oxidoreductase n=1 Tax=Thalassococcus lentus TaxID=1210524 RepID=A0ABT4XNU0_9RHOB|nr:NAD(P)H-dependent oxidoreductase [Thalassococcus lentus]MDA7423611.1 NAD(P)H-dependent oxidoreductase [Thalassococcus lentus]